MSIKNKYVKHAHIPENKFKQIILLFSEDLSATQISHLTKISRLTINKYLMDIRIKIAQLSHSQPPHHLGGEVEIDESYFQARRIKRKRGRGASGKTIVFGLLKRGGNVYTEIVPNYAATTLTKIIRGKTSLDAIIHSDGWKAYDGLVDLSILEFIMVKMNLLEVILTLTE